MNQDQLQQTIQGIIQNLSQEIPTYQWSTDDWSKHDGNVAVCIIDEEGNVYGRIWGNDKLKGRKTFDAAYRKAMQVWITGYATGDYEKKVFNGELNHRDYGIDLPELIGWQGGQPIQLNAETRICCGFSGFKGATDLLIVKKAVEDSLF